MCSNFCFLCQYYSGCLTLGFCTRSVSPTFVLSPLHSGCDFFSSFPDDPFYLDDLEYDPSDPFGFIDPEEYSEEYFWPFYDEP